MDENQLKNLSPQQKDELMRNVQTQVALANMQELLTVSKHQKLLFLLRLTGMWHVLLVGQTNVAKKYA